MLHVPPQVMRAVFAGLFSLAKYGRYRYDETLNWVSGPPVAESDAEKAAAREFQEQPSPVGP
jgi:hypothetical protein